MFFLCVYILLLYCLCMILEEATVNMTQKGFLNCCTILAMWLSDSGVWYMPSDWLVSPIMWFISLAKDWGMPTANSSKQCILGWWDQYGFLLVFKKQLYSPCKVTVEESMVCWHMKIMSHLSLFYRNHFVCWLSQWETVLICNIVFHWLSSYPTWLKLYAV